MAKFIKMRDIYGKEHIVNVDRIKTLHLFQGCYCIAVDGVYDVLKVSQEEYYRIADILLQL